MVTKGDKRIGRIMVKSWLGCSGMQLQGKEAVGGEGKSPDYLPSDQLALRPGTPSVRLGAAFAIVPGSRPVSPQRPSLGLLEKKEG